MPLLKFLVYSNLKYLPPPLINYTDFTLTGPKRWSFEEGSPLTSLPHASLVCQNQSSIFIYVKLASDVSVLTHVHNLGWFSMSPLPRLHHHNIMTIVGLFFIYVPFVTIRCIILMLVLKIAQCTAVVSSTL